MKTIKIIAIFSFVLTIFSANTASANTGNDKESTATESVVYPGGNQALVQFINDNLVYPQSARENGVEGTVIVKFEINPTGTIEGIKVEKGLNESCNQAALDVIGIMPTWSIPAKQPVTNVKVKLPIRFALD